MKILPRIIWSDHIFVWQLFQSISKDVIVPKLEYKKQKKVFFFALTYLTFKIINLKTLS